jgi:hypothetical protein
MKSISQKFLFNFIIFFFLFTIIEYLFKFGFKEISLNKLMAILPRMAIDFGLIALFFGIYYLIKFRRKKQENNT